MLMNPKDNATVFSHIADERLAAHLKHGEKSMENGDWDDPTGRRYRILLEEIGEVARELNDAEIENRDVNPRALYQELIQCGAMVVAWAARIDASGALIASKYDY